jgi:hypothetical protein
MADCGNVFCDASPRKGILSLKHLDTAGRKYRKFRKPINTGKLTKGNITTKINPASTIFKLKLILYLIFQYW